VRTSPAGHRRPAPMFPVSFQAVDTRAGLLVLVLVLLSVLAIVPSCLVTSSGLARSGHVGVSKFPQRQRPTPWEASWKTAAGQHPLESGSGRHQQEKETSSKLQKL